MKVVVDSCVFIDAFDPQSANHAASLEVLEQLTARKIVPLMPAHGWFEVQCALKRLEAENRFVGPRVAGFMQQEVELLHIDQAFIKAYQMVRIPRLKASDHIFVAVALRKNYPLISSDTQMLDVASSIGVNSMTPARFVELIKAKAATLSGDSDR